MKQLDLFEGEYRTLDDLLQIVEKCNPTGGFDENWKPIPMGYKIDFYKDLAFIVLFRDECDNNEKIIDNAIYLHQVGEDLYEIYQIDGKIFGQMENNELLELRYNLINALKNKEVFRR